jgi:cadmium resistance protein CadD (predicted permease)
MKRAIILIGLAFGAVIAISAALFDGVTLSVVVVAMMIVTVFGLAPVFFGIITRRNEQGRNESVHEEVITLEDLDRAEGSGGAAEPGALMERVAEEHRSGAVPTPIL